MNSNVFTILRLLSDGQLHTGASIANQLGCSRSTISNVLKDIDSYGINLSKIRGSGYRWLYPIQWLDSNAIFNFPLINYNYYDLLIFDSIDSTNNLLLNSSKNLHVNNSRIPVVAAEFQTNGRGRLGHTWYAGLGESLTFSLRWRFEQGISALSGLSLVIGIAIVRVLNSFSINKVNLKWPNDILFDHHKLAGVLIEVRGEILGPSYAVVGVGINFKLSKIVKSVIQQKATDLTSITGESFNRNYIFRALLLELRGILILFEKWGFSYFKDEWISYHAYEGYAVFLTLPNGYVIEGTVDGVNDDGSICLITTQGRKYYNVGDCSLRLSA